MSEYYNPKRTRNLYQPKSSAPFKLSRSKLELFLDCPRCFYLDRRLGIGRPPGFPFSLNSAVDTLLKKEFDIHRIAKTPHPLMSAYGLKAVPFQDERLDTWRENFKGIEYLHPATNLLITGAVDDLWQNEKGEIIIVDYKSTSKEGEVNLDADWQDGYKRQMEIYQWLFRHNEFKVSDTGYFVYVNGRTDLAAFDGKLEFKIKLIPYTGDDSWVDQTIKDAHQCLEQDAIPSNSPRCDYCGFQQAAEEALKNNPNEIDYD